MAANNRIIVTLACGQNVLLQRNEVKITKARGIPPAGQFLHVHQGYTQATMFSLKLQCVVDVAVDSSKLVFSQK